MLLTDLIYQTIKGCVWLKREISKEKIFDNTYQGDIDLGSFVNNVYVALNDSFTLGYSLNKVSPILLTKVFAEELTLNEEDIVLVFNIFFKNNNEHIEFSFKNGYLKLLNKSNLSNKGKEIVIEGVKRLPYLTSSSVSLDNDIELKDYGISDNLALILSDYARAILYRDIDPNVSYKREQMAISKINALKDYGETFLETQRNVETDFVI